VIFFWAGAKPRTLSGYANSAHNYGVHAISDADGSNALSP